MKPIVYWGIWGCSTIKGYEVGSGVYVLLQDKRRNNGGLYTVEIAKEGYPAYDFETVFSSADLQECKSKLIETAKTFCEGATV